MNEQQNAPAPDETDEEIVAAAEAAGMSVPQYLQMQELERKNAALKAEARKQAEQERKKKQAQHATALALIVIVALAVGFVIGRASLSGSPGPDLRGLVRAQPEQFILNTETKVFHYPECQAVDLMLEENKMYVTTTHQEVLQMGYWSCEICKP